MKRLHTTNELQLDLTREYSDYGSSRDYFKPKGLWYGLDRAWFEWCESENYGGIGDYTYELELDLDDILIISDKRQLLLFFNDYKIEMYPDYFGIDWRKVKSDYRGIEIQNYHSYRWSALPLNRNTWLYGWDCDSGCIWDLCAVKSFESVEEKPLV